VQSRRALDPPCLANVRLPAQSSGLDNHTRNLPFLVSSDQHDAATGYAVCRRQEQRNFKNIVVTDHQPKPPKDSGGKKPVYSNGCQFGKSEFFPSPDAPAEIGIGD
jgi:hypothetical protein